nr:hypothetical protein [Tanacetum cinerariifolium]
MATDYGIVKEEMSILSGRKSVPRMNSRKRGKWKGKTTRSSHYCIMKEGMSTLRGRKSVPGMNSSKREMER